ncbi:MAG TPA: hypothetical protein VFZ31_14235 [Vicinamibacterales bacterium]
MKHALSVALAVVLTAALSPAGRLHAAPIAHAFTAGTVKVTVTYQGKGKVDSAHKLWVYLFDTPTIGPGTIPVGQVALDKNGADAVFEDVAGDKVYVAVAFDEHGTMMGDGPPPSGSPIGILSGADGAPSAVTPGAQTGAVLNFDDTQRMP